MTDLHYTPAVELARMLRARELSARELLQAFLDRIESINPRINAIVTLVPEPAMAAAAADQAASRGEFLGPLHGLPIAVKDLAETAGIRTTFGSPLFADHVPRHDCAHVTALRRAGAIIIGKTNTPEFGAGSQTFNPVFGVTRNPYDPELTPGGSSGGAAAAVAAGLLPFADGSDLAASVRNPAAFCNLVGLRTTPGLVPGDDPFEPLSVIGPIARTPADAALLLAGLAGDDPRLPMARADDPQHYLDLRPADPAGVRVAWSVGLTDLPVEPVVAAVLAQARETLVALGCEVVDTAPDLADADPVFQVLRARFLASLGPLLESGRDRMKDTLVWNIEKGLALTGAELSEAMDRRRQIFLRMRGFLSGPGPAGDPNPEAAARGGRTQGGRHQGGRHHDGGRRDGVRGTGQGRDDGGFDLLALPTTQVAPFSVENEWVASINGEPQSTYIDWMRSCSRITVTAHPAITVPAGFTPNGLPVGLQLVAPYGADHALLRFAQAYTEATGHTQVRPRL